MLRIWIFFNKQTIYLEETTAQRKNQIAERAGANLIQAQSFMEISTSTTEYVPLRSVLRGSICHFQSNLAGQLQAVQPP